MPTLTSNPSPVVPAKARKPRKHRPYILQLFDEADGWLNISATSGSAPAPDSFAGLTAAMKFVREGKHVGKFRVIRVVSEFTSAIEERKVVKLT